MRYRARHLGLNLALPVLNYTFLVIWALWTFDAALEPDLAATLGRGAAGFTVVLACAAVFATYWPTTRRPAQLYHVTTTAVVEAATVATHEDGTRTLELRAKRPGRPVYFFARWPRRSAVEFNVKNRPDICIELVDVDYHGVTVRRRWTGAYRLRNVGHLRARVHPLPWELDRPRPTRRGVS